MIDPAWQGNVNFYELVFGTWLAYAFLVLMWERALKTPLAEWQYVLITFLGAGAFWINHYFQRAPFYSPALNAYTLAFLAAYYYVCVRPQTRSLGWKLGASATAILFTIAFILFENIARFGVSQGLSEFWFMLIAFFGFLLVILWRGRGQPAAG